MLLNIHAFLVSPVPPNSPVATLMKCLLKLMKVFTFRYIAACAPHVQEFFHPPPVRGSYDYLRLTRNNHMPLPTWTYGQLLNDGWDFKVTITTLVACTVMSFLCMGVLHSILFNEENEEIQI